MGVWSKGQKEDVGARQAIEGGKAGREQPKPGRKNEEKQNEKKGIGEGRMEKKAK
jgi:hypothetical protein